MKTAICTPTATREEFESILRELDGIGVKWKSGGSPITNSNYWINSGNKLSYNWCGDRELTMAGKDSEVLSSAEFIAAIKRDFAPKIDCSYPTEIKERPKMNYNKMTKAELISKLKAERRDVNFLQVEIKKRDAENVELRAKWNEQNEANNKAFGECANLKDINRELLGDTKQLEKTNAEQAETIENIRNRSIAIEEVARTAQDERDKANSALRIANAKLEKQTASISRFFADVLEGK